MHEAESVPWQWLEAVHDPELVRRIRTGNLSVREARGLGLPWSPQLVERSRRSVAGTIAASRFALGVGLGMNLGGGTHHAGRSFARGYCVFNDVAIALSRLRADGAVKRALIVDCDVHQGDGTADLLGPDPDTFTLSLHGARNYPFQRIPSDLDVDIASGTGDDATCGLERGARLRAAARRRRLRLLPRRRRPMGGRPARQARTHEGGLRARDELVLDRLRGDGIPVCVVLAGGYAEDVNDTVDIHAATADAVAERIEPQPSAAR